MSKEEQRRLRAGRGQPTEQGSPPAGSRGTPFPKVGEVGIREYTWLPGWRAGWGKEDTSLGEVMIWGRSKVRSVGSRRLILKNT